MQLGRAVQMCNGGGNSAVEPMIAEGVDTLVTGELREEWFNHGWSLGSRRLFLCGHHRRVPPSSALPAEVSAKFGLPWEFIATENPL